MMCDVGKEEGICRLGAGPGGSGKGPMMGWDCKAFGLTWHGFCGLWLVRMVLILQEGAGIPVRRSVDC
jgi:hypothetical protein